MDRSDFPMAGEPAKPRLHAANKAAPGGEAEASVANVQGVLRLVEEQAQVGFWIHDVSTDRITVSQGLARISGIPVTAAHTREAMLGCIHPQDRPYQSDIMALIDNGQPLRREFRIVRPDGTIRWVSLRIDVALSDEGQPVRFVGVVADITERREAQRAVEYNHGRSAALLEATSALTWIADLSGQSVDNTAWCELTGMRPEHCGGGGWLDAVHPNDRDRVRASYRVAIARREIYNVDYRVMTREGVYRWYNARSAPIRDGSGTIREWQGVLLPIDDQHRPMPGAACAEPAALTGALIRGARGLLDWSLAQLASVSGVSVSTIKRMEDGSEGTTRPSKAEAVRRALELGGVNFHTADGVTWISR